MLNAKVTNLVGVEFESMLHGEWKQYGTSTTAPTKNTLVAHPR